MKAVRIVFVVFLGLIMAGSWFLKINGVLKDNAAYDAALQEAEELLENRLYQKAANSFEAALGVREELHARERLTAAYEMGWEDGSISYSQYAGALLTMCGKYPEQTECWETLLQLQIEQKKFDDAFDTVKKLIKENITSQRLEELKTELRYSFTAAYKSYVEVFHSPQGGFVLNDGRGYGVSDSQGEELIGCDYVYISPMNAEGYAAYTNSTDTRLKDKNDVVQAIITEEMPAMRAYGSGVFPVQQGDGWRYYDAKEGYVLDTYDDASSFTDGIAAVKKGDAWQLIDSNGEKIGDKQFDDIKLYGNGTASCWGAMIASENGKYNLYTTAGEQVCALNAGDADIYMGSYIAFQDKNGKWGYTTAEGDVVIEPAFAEAKSFSNGLAAVSNGELWGFINESGELVIDYQFHDADYFTSGGVCFVSITADVMNMIALRFPEGY